MRSTSAVGTPRTTIAIVALGVALALGPLGPGAGSADAQEGDSCAGRGLPPEQVGIQLYTARGAVDSDGLDTVLGFYADLGMTNIERFGGSFGLGADDFVATWEDAGVTPVGSHGDLDVAGFQAEIDEALSLGQTYIGSGGWAPPGIDSLEDTLATAAAMDTLGQMADDAGLRVYGHNHDREFSALYDYDLDGDGEAEPARAIEILMAETDPDLVSFEVDVHWARLGIAGGRGDPDLVANLAAPSNQEALRAFGRAHADRIHLLHVKDTAPSSAFAEVGQGTTDWPAFFETVPDVDHYFIEHDSPPDSYETAEIGWQYLTCDLYDDNGGEQSIHVTVPDDVEPGEFIWTIRGDGSVDLGETVDQGTSLQATGSIDPILVTDTRIGGPEWSITGQASDFDPDGPTGDHLGWAPTVVVAGAGATAGPEVASTLGGGDGLAVPSVLASADAGHDDGTGEVGADVDLRFPVDTEPGEYTSTITITALS